MTTIKVVKPFNLLLAPNEAPVRFEVGEHEVEQHVADHWYVQPHLEGADETAPAEAPAAFNPETATRDELLAFVRGSFEVYLSRLDDDELRRVAAYHAREDESEDEDDLPPEPATPATGAEAGPDANDTLTGTGSEAGDAGADTLTGGQGSDSITGEGSETGQGGDDTLNGGQGNDSLGGSAGEGSATATSGADSLNGGAGDDAFEKTDGKKAGTGKAAAKSKA